MLTLAFSTLLHTAPSLIERLNRIELSPKISIVVIVQNLQNKGHKLPNLNRGEVHIYKEKGISRSRNRAIEKSNTDYIWFLDDDVELVMSGVEEVLEFLEEESPDAMTVRIGSLEKPTDFYKEYQKNLTGYKNSQIMAMKVSSIELIVSKEYITTNGIKFQENVGLGTQFPCTEENIFVLDLLKRKARFFFSEIVAVLHTTKMDQRLKISEGHYKARGQLLKYLPFYWRFFLLIRWSIRCDKEVGFISRVRFLIKGIN
ncbi:glycosyltransferase family 2 protein [Vibrio sp. 10N.261.49.A5]|uniref:Glycosyltransferase 2-like domain-containing protein n=1 Tax=Vibrio tasmaniensis 1F-267 TaxID=1191324 RepID=A0ABX3B1G6_9VIBR|nr:glycosyltransferase family A protein [Vibrio tasmaniensis]OEF43735.1 hypothetical protein A163_01345 [Vibrio tasmaniensis 1F-267]